MRQKETYDGSRFEIGHPRILVGDGAAKSCSVQVDGLETRCWAAFEAGFDGGSNLGFSHPGLQMSLMSVALCFTHVAPEKPLDLE